MLRVCLLHQHESSVHHTNTKLDTLGIFSHDSETGSPRRAGIWPDYGSVCARCLFQGHKRCIAQFRNQESTTLRLTIVIIHSAIPSQVEMLAISVFAKDTTAQCALCGHQTNNLKITTQRSITVTLRFTPPPINTDSITTKKTSFLLA